MKIENMRYRAIHKERKIKYDVWGIDWLNNSLTIKPVGEIANKNLEIVEFSEVVLIRCFEEQGERKSFELKGGCANNCGDYCFGEDCPHFYQ